MRRKLWAVCLAVASPCLARAENLLVNPDFVGLGEWSLAPAGAQGRASWQAADAGGQGSSGSVRLGNTANTATTAVTLGQCVPVTAGLRYTLAGHLRMPSGAGANLDGLAQITVWWHDDAACASPHGLPLGVGRTPPRFDVWTMIGPAELAAPEGVRSALVRAVVVKYPATGAFTADFDNLFFGPGPLPVELLRFDVE